MSTPPINSSFNLESVAISIAEAREVLHPKPTLARSVSFAPEGKLVTFITDESDTTVSEFHRSKSDSGVQYQVYSESENEDEGDGLMESHSQVGRRSRTTSTCGEDEHAVDIDATPEEEKSVSDIDESSSDSDCEENTPALVSITMVQKKELLKKISDEREDNQRKIAEYTETLGKGDDDGVSELMANIRALKYRQTVLNRQLGYVNRNLLPPLNLN
ncbi:hypothetical protein SOPP22_06785 [Shewanella sp. OPT22]|nr:hypothetical protein SOPP22_06785 [Shewanella sp. OPT22]